MAAKAVSEAASAMAIPPANKLHTTTERYDELGEKKTGKTTLRKTQNPDRPRPAKKRRV